MKTYFIGRTEVKGYCNDLATRLLDVYKNDPPSFPSVWCLIGQSGEAIAYELLGVISDLNAEVARGISVVFANCQKKTHSVVLSDADADADVLRAAGSVLVVDSAVHSGGSMWAVVKKVRQCGVATVLSYSLTLKRGSAFVPNYFGLMIDDHDRALFLLDSFPNNRLCESQPFGCVRRLMREDLAGGRPVILGNEIPLGDLFYEQEVRGVPVYIFDGADGIEGCLAFRLMKPSVLFVELLIAKGDKVGGVLLRWAESWARSNNCESIVLRVADAELYIKQGFEIVVDSSMSLEPGVDLVFVRRRLLYNLGRASAFRL